MLTQKVASCTHTSVRLACASNESLLLHGIAQQLHDGEHQGPEGQGPEGGPQGMLEGPHGGSLIADEARRAEVPLSDGARDGENPDLKHQEDAP